MYFQKHIFFCNNLKADGKKCCAQGNPGSEMRDFAKAKLKEWGIPLGEEGIRVSQSGCLGRCSEGPNIVIYPEGVWYHYRDAADVEKILRGHIVEGKIVYEFTI